MAVSLSVHSITPPTLTHPKSQRKKHFLRSPLLLWRAQLPFIHQPRTSWSEGILCFSKKTWPPGSRRAASSLGAYESHPATVCPPRPGPVCAHQTRRRPAKARLQFNTGTSSKKQQPKLAWTLVFFSGAKKQFDVSLVAFTHITNYWNSERIVRFSVCHVR